MKRGTKIAIGIGFALVIGVLVYFIVKTMRGTSETTKAQTGDRTGKRLIAREKLINPEILAKLKAQSINNQ